MRRTRIHLEAPLNPGAELPLSSAGAYHVARVLRMRAGAALLVFDGAGREHEAEIVALEGDSVRVRIGKATAHQTESPLRITLVLGISRSERMDWALQKSTELGVSAIAPVLTARSVVRLDDKQANKKQQHWHGIVAGACEQCGRSYLPQVAMPVPLRQYLSSSRKDGMRLVLSPGAPASLAGLASLPPKVELLIGPEGGLDDEELRTAQQAGFLEVRLGPRVLRTETAVVTALSVLQALWGDLQ